MSAPIIVLRNQNGWGSLNEDFALPQQNPHGNGCSNFHRERFGAIFAHTVVPVMRTVRALNSAVGFTQTRGISHNPDTKSVRICFESARVTPACADTGGLSAVSSSAARLRFKFFPALKVAGDLLSIGFHRALTVCQDTARQLANAFHFFNLSKQAVAHCNGRTVERKERSCPTRDGSRMTRNGAKVS